MLLLGREMVQNNTFGIFYEINYIMVRILTIGDILGKDRTP